MLWRGDVLFSLALVGILVVLILPLHPVILDIALAVSLAFSVLILMAVLFLEDPLELSIFPTILLVTTMLRLALNVASTRLILTNGYLGGDAAGQVIKAFGSFIMGGNFIIGMVVFAILVIINFVVITKGSGRIAEVVARFSLDALPGKQMAVDADLSSGIIDQKEAKRRRAQIQDEINFYGAMDGAAKFVRGDAIAGLLITAINLVGGILVGTLQRGLTFSYASSTYSFLTVGDGLVAQIPALVVSVAAGMLISKTSSKGNANQTLVGQLSAYPKALGMSAFMMGVLALLPGMPALPFMGLAVLSGLAAFRLGQSQSAAAVAASEAEKVPAREDGAEPTVQEMLAVDQVKLELGVGLVSLIKNEGDLRGRISKMRQVIAQDFGLVIPTVRIVDNLSLETYTYRLLVNEVKAGEGRIYPNRLMAINPHGGPTDLVGEMGKEPVLGMDGVWIQENQRPMAKEKGCVLADGKGLMITHLTEILKRFLPDLMTFAMQQQLVDELPKAHQKLYTDIVPLQLPAATIQRVLKNLLAERVSIRNLPLIIESLAEGMSDTKDPGVLTERVRVGLTRQICASHLSKDGTLRLAVLSDEWTHFFYKMTLPKEKKDPLQDNPEDPSKFWERIQEVYAMPSMKTTAVSHAPPPLLVGGVIRRHVHGVLEQIRPDIPVLSDAELLSSLTTEVLEKV